MCGLPPAGGHRAHPPPRPAAVRGDVGPGEVFRPPGFLSDPANAAEARLQRGHAQCARGLLRTPHEARQAWKLLRARDAADKRGPAGLRLEYRHKPAHGCLDPEAALRDPKVGTHNLPRRLQCRG